MPDATIRGVTLNYRVFGTSGPWIAFTPGSRRGFGELVTLAERIASAGYRVLLHDRRNCGASEVGIEPIASEHEIWADDFDLLCKQLGATPIWAGGSSAGARLALLFALRHPESVSGLLLWRVTGGAHAAEKLSQQYYGAFIALADKGGMEAVCASEHFAECIRARPSNRDRLMSMSPKDFIDTMAMAQALPSGRRPAGGGRDRGRSAILEDSGLHHRGQR
jgi:pimeloyl-ACP methyl ester carboxylesterase